MPKYETAAGQFSRADTHAKLIDLIKQCEDCCFILSHSYGMQDNSRDLARANGWRAAGHAFEIMETKMIQLATAGVGKQ